MYHSGGSLRLLCGEQVDGRKDSTCSYAIFITGYVSNLYSQEAIKTHPIFPFVMIKLLDIL
jgi:hypothetical protein